MMKLAPRAIIDDAFLSVMLEVYKSVLRKKANELDLFTGRGQAGPNNIKPVIQRLTPIINNINTDGRWGMDYEKTRLRILPFTHFSALNYGDQIWLIGRTNPVIIVDKGVTFHLGPYKVCIPKETLETGSLNNVHFIPLKAPRCVNRHPHHMSNMSVDEAKEKNPLSERPRTCWGNYGPVISALINDGDIPELFRQFYIYLTRYNSSSPLIHSHNYSSNRGIRCLDFDYATPWVEPEAK